MLPSSGGIVCKKTTGINLNERRAVIVRYLAGENPHLFLALISLINIDRKSWIFLSDFLKFLEISWKIRLMKTALDVPFGLLTRSEQVVDGPAQSR